MRKRATAGFDEEALDLIHAKAAARGMTVGHWIEYTCLKALKLPCSTKPRTRGWPKGRKRK